MIDRVGATVSNNDVVLAAAKTFVATGVAKDNKIYFYESETGKIKTANPSFFDFYIMLPKTHCEETAHKVKRIKEFLEENNL